MKFDLGEKRLIVSLIRSLEFARRRRSEPEPERSSRRASESEHQYRSEPGREYERRRGRDPACRR